MVISAVQSDGTAMQIHIPVRVVDSLRLAGGTCGVTRSVRRFLVKVGPVIERRSLGKDLLVRPYIRKLFFELIDLPGRDHHVPLDLRAQGSDCLRNRNEQLIHDNERSSCMVHHVGQVRGRQAEVQQ